MTRWVKPFSLEQCGEPINKSVDDAGGDAVDDNRAGDGERWERCRWQIKRPERVAAVGEGRRRMVAEDIRRAPQQENILAPTPKIKPSACVQLGPITVCLRKKRL